MSKCLQFYVFLFLSIILLSCSRQPDELNTAEQLIETAPDSALHILRGLSPDNYKSGANRALYGLLMIRTLDKKMLPLKPDSLLNYSIAWYEKNPEHDRLATCYLYKGRTYKYYFQYEKAVNCYLKALDIIKNKDDLFLIGKINSDMGQIYLIQCDYENARQKYKLAYDIFLKGRYNVLAYYSLIDIGRTFSLHKLYKNALLYFDKVIYESNDSMLIGSALQEKGLTYYFENNYDSALVYYRRVISYPYIRNNRAIRYCYLANVYFNLNKIDSAYYYAINSFNYESDIRTQRECYRILTNSEFKNGHMRVMSMYMNKYVVIGDSIRKIESQTKGSYIETLHSTRKDAKVEKIQKWISWGALFLAIVGFLFLLKRIFIKVRKEKKEILETHTEEKLGIHKRVIEDKRAVLQKQIEDRKTIMLIEFKNAGSQERELQLRKIYKVLLHFDEPEQFFAEMDKFLNRLITKLKSRYSTLNEKELMLCCYLMLHIPTYDMLILFGYKSDDSLKSLKRRLPKKFKLENATHLEDFLLSILSEN